MHLSRLNIHGFKSFATPTVLQFDPGITAIVGPNGCGKSNIVDAIRWVVGEQRARILRSEKMDNIIFNGTARRRGLGMAEVQLTVQNTRGLLPTEYSEVTLGRRLYRSGDSEYLLNDTPCRMRDVVDLFLDTGMGAGAYSVIELKMIEDILSESTQDRRRLFEEAAGITKYKQRRAQALWKLESIQADLTRVQDLTDEIARRVKRLDRQAAMASRHAELRRRAHALALAIARIEYERLAAQVAGLKAGLVEWRDTLVELKSQHASQEALLQAHKKAHVDRESAVVQHERAHTDHLKRVGERTATLRLQQERYAARRRDLARAEQQRDETIARCATLEASLEELCTERVSTLPRCSAATEELEAAGMARDDALESLALARASVTELTGRQSQLLTLRSRHLREYDQITNKIDLLEAERKRLGSEAEGMVRRLEDGQARIQEARSKSRAAQLTAAEAEEALAQATAQHDELGVQIDSADRVLRELSESHAAKQAEASFLAALVGGYEDFPEATKYLAGSVQGLVTVSDILETSAGYRAALAAALGPFGGCIVVRTVQEAQRAVALLKKEEKGRALFVVLDRLPESVPAPAKREGLTPLLDLISVTEPVYRPLAALVLQDTYYAEQLPDASATTGRLPVRVVSASGEWNDGRGFLYGGGTAVEVAAQHMDRRERLKDLQAARAALKERLDRQQDTVSMLGRQQTALALDAHRAARTAALQALTAARHEEARHQRDHASLQERVQLLHGRVRSSDAQVLSLKGQADGPQAASAELRKRLDGLAAEISSSQDALSTAESVSRAAQDHYAAARLADQEVRNVAERIERDTARVAEECRAAAAQVAALSAGTEEAKAALTALSADISESKAALAAEQGRRVPLEAAVRKAKTRLMETRVAIDQLEQSLRKHRKAHDDAVREERERAVQCAALAAKMDEVAAMAQEKYGAVPADADVPEDSDEAGMREELETVRTKLRKMGSVNLLALEEYEKEKERHTFMVAQWEDLRQAEATLLETTDEINKAAAKRFRETYAAIRGNFCKIFRELFGGDTSADLHLTEGASCLESPIAITAQPRGKRPISISQLSSGEKTLTAIALLFAIYQVKPSPFCFLDEVDAPLDDANIERFMRLIRRFSLDTQFVLVTHNKRTMEMADRLYGITMQEEGVSSLVGVRFEEAMAMAT